MGPCMSSSGSQGIGVLKGWRHGILLMGHHSRANAEAFNGRRFPDSVYEINGPCVAHACSIDDPPWEMVTGCRRIRS